MHGGGSGIEQRDQKLKMYRESFLTLTLAAKRLGMVVVMPSMTNSSRVRSEKFDVANHVVRGQYIVEQHERS